MKKYLKIMLVLVVALSMLSSFAFADPTMVGSGEEQPTGTSDPAAGSTVSTGNSFEKVVNKGTDSSNSLTTATKNIGATVINLVQTLGYMIAVIMVVVVGIQWLIGTPAKKQELKGRLINVIVGAVLIACGVTILGFIAKVGNEMGDNLTKTSSIEFSTRA